MSLRLKVLGAAGTVTGSCHLLHDERTGRYHLVDCGAYQGPGAKALNAARFVNGTLGGVPCAKISTAFLTHAHLDHCGLFPQLVAQGFKGPIYCTEFTKQATLISLRDACGYDDALTPAMVSALERQLTAIDDTKFQLGWFRPIVPDEKHLGFSFVRTSHLLGCVGVNFLYNERPENTASRDEDRIQVNFGGDIGPVRDAAAQGSLCKDLQYPTEFTRTIVLESTYGGKTRTAPLFDERLTALAATLERACAGHANPVVVIPAFALQRTHDVLLDLASLLLLHPERVPSLFRDGRPPRVRAVSELARDFGRHIVNEFTRLNIKGKPSFANTDHPLLAGYADAAERRRLLAHVLTGQYDETLGAKLDFHFDSAADPRSSGCTIILGSGGMADSGKIVSVLKQTLRRADCTVLLTGYQAPASIGGTLTRLAAGQPETRPAHFVEVLGFSPDDVRATTHSIGHLYSGHADETGLVNYALRKDRDDKSYSPVTLLLVHGENEARNRLREALQRFAVEHPAQSRPLESILLPNPDSGWYDCRARRFVDDESPDAGAQLAATRLRLATLQAEIARFLSGDIDERALAGAAAEAERP